MKPEKQKAIISKVVSTTNQTEKDALAQWAEGLLNLKYSNLTKVQKGKEAIKLSAKSSVILPILKTLARELKLDQVDISKIDSNSVGKAGSSVKAFWKNRSFPMKLGLSASAISAIVFGSQGAGIAALGGAIGVPLWVVFGAGAVFVGNLYEEITGQKPNISTQYEVIDANPTKMKRVKDTLRKLVDKIPDR